MELARALAGEILTKADPLKNPRLDLAQGLAGQALLFAELAHGPGDGHVWFELTNECLLKMVRDLAHTELGPGLFSGLAGVAWSLQHIGRRLEVADYLRPDGYEEVYDYYDAFLSRCDADSEYDLIGGLAGIGTWALSVADEARRERLIVAILERLAANAQHTSQGVTWRTPPTRKPLAAGNDEAGAHIEHNLGIAHGVPGVIGFLAGCVRHDVAPALSRALLAPAASWLMAQKLEGALSSFAYVAGTSNASRLAWCYGDPGVALALCAAARALQSTSIQSFARDVAEKSAARRMADSQVRDAGLCHGAAGLALVYSRLHACMQGSIALAGAASYWHETLKTMRRADRGICGFRSWMPGDEYVDDAGWLTGASGIALVLLSQVSGDVRWADPLLTGN